MCTVHSKDCYLLVVTLRYGADGDHGGPGHPQCFRCHHCSLHVNIPGLCSRWRLGSNPSTHPAWEAPGACLPCDVGSSSLSRLQPYVEPGPEAPAGFHQSPSRDHLGPSQRGLPWLPDPPFPHLYLQRFTSTPRSDRGIRWVVWRNSLSAHLWDRSLWGFKALGILLSEATSLKCIQMDPCATAHISYINYRSWVTIV